MPRETIPALLGLIETELVFYPLFLPPPHAGLTQFGSCFPAARAHSIIYPAQGSPVPATSGHRPVETFIYFTSIRTPLGLPSTCI